MVRNKYKTPKTPSLQPKRFFPSPLTAGQCFALFSAVLYPRLLSVAEGLGCALPWGPWSWLCPIFKVDLNLCYVFITQTVFPTDLHLVGNLEKI